MLNAPTSVFCWSTLEYSYIGGHVILSDQTQMILWVLLTKLLEIKKAGSEQLDVQNLSSLASELLFNVHKADI
jgi:hypothetical protein